MATPQKTRANPGAGSNAAQEDAWRARIDPLARLKVMVRDACIQWIYNPIQVVRRRNGYADRDLFRHVLIQSNYRCTRKCAFCHYGLPDSPVNAEMSAELFARIIHELASIPYAGRLGLFEMNEPLTDKRFPVFLRYARRRLPAAWIFISSNGDLLSREKATALFDDGLNVIYLSSYDAAALARNHAWVAALSPQHRKKVHHIDRTYQTEWSSRGGHVSRFRKTPVSAPCDMVHRVCYIKPSGKIYSCYNDFYDINEMGDLNRQKIIDVWFGNRFRHLRRELIAGNRGCSRLCSQCDYIGYGNLPKIPVQWWLKTFLRRQ